MDPPPSAAEADCEADNDQLFPDEVREAGSTVLRERNIEHEMKVFPGVPHGKRRQCLP